jgi:gliding motility-associated-like protein
MRRILVLIFLIKIQFTLLAEGLNNPNNTSQLDYISNDGQWEENVLFKADLKGGFVFVEKNKLTYLFYDSEKIAHTHHNHDKYIIEDGKKKLNPDFVEENSDDKINAHAYNIEFLHANLNTTLSKEQKSEYYFNYYLGADESKWATNVGAYKVVKYENLYNKIDAKVYSNGFSMKTDYIVKSGGDPNSIKLKYNGLDKIAIDVKGNLVLTTSINTITEFAPYTYQIINGNKKEIKTKYLLNNNIISFEVLEDYDKNYDLIIDPTLVFSTYSGSTVDNWGSSSTFDNNGNMYLGGIAFGTGYPTTTGAFQTTYGGGSGGFGSDVVITKFTTVGNARVYSTYIGGTSNELLSSLINTSQNKLVALIVTSSPNFPTTTTAFDRSFNGGNGTSAMDGSISLPNGTDVAIVKFEVNGASLNGSTFFGGNGNDGLNKAQDLLYNYGDESRNDIEIDANDNILIATNTTSNNIPNTAGKAQPSNGGGSSDGLIAKFNSNLSTLNWATYFGGSNSDGAYSILLDNAANIYICGGTKSNNLQGINNGLNKTYRGGRTDGYVAKLDPNGNSVLSTTYLGTNDYDQAFIIDIDKSNNIYVFGNTLGSYATTAGVYKNNNARQFIHKLNSGLNTTLFSTTFGNPNYDYTNISPTALLIDVCGNIYAAGWGGGPNASFQFDAGYTTGMPLTSDAYKSNSDGDDFYFISLNQDATTLLYGSYFGENGGEDHVDGGTSRFDKNGIIYQGVCASCGGSDNFPTTQGAYSRNNNSSNCNMAGIKFQFDLKSMQILTTRANPASGCAPLNVSFSYTASRTPSTVLWKFGDGSTSNINAPTHTYSAAGTYTVKLIIQNPNECNPIDSSSITVIVTTPKSSTISRSICQGQTTTVGNQTFSTAGTYNIPIPVPGGCDSIVTLILTTKPNTSSTVNRSICQGESVTIGTQSFNTSGTFTIKLSAANTCDSTITLNLVVNPKRNTTLNREICEGESITVGTQSFNNSGTFTVPLKTFQNCDSIITLNLIVNPKKFSTIEKSICQGSSFTVGTQSFSTTGTYNIKLASSKNCDSTVTLRLFVVNTIQTQINPSICRGDSIKVGNQYFKESGSYQVMFVSSSNCDSIVTVNLSIIEPKLVTLNKQICPGGSFSVGNQNFTTTGTFNINLKSSANCDSIVTLNLEVTNLINENRNSTICEGRSLTIGDSTFDKSGNYTIRINTLSGCDTLVNLNLFVIKKDTSDIERTICSGDSVMIGNQVFKESGAYEVILPSTNSCDSLVRLNLTVNLPSFTSIIDTICFGESLLVGDSLLEDSGNYTIVLKNTSNCDSTINITLTVIPPIQFEIIADSQLVYSGSTIQLNTSTTLEGVTYQWQPSNNVSNAQISNPTSIVNSSTWYYLTITTTNNCKNEDSLFVEVRPTEIPECEEKNVFLPNAFSPNGDGENDVYYIESNYDLDKINFMIFNRWGQKVFETDDELIGWDGTFNGKPALGDSFGYVFEGICGTRKIKRSGNITIIR